MNKKFTEFLKKFDKRYLGHLMKYDPKTINSYNLYDSVKQRPGSRVSHVVVANTRLLSGSTIVYCGVISGNSNLVDAYIQIILNKKTYITHIDLIYYLNPL